MTDIPSMSLHTYRQYLPIEAESARDARDFADEILNRWRLDEDHIEDVKLVADEIVANGVTHGKGAPPARNIYLELIVWSKWTLVVVDDRDPNVYDCPVADDEFALSGRGLIIVRGLAERFWWHQRQASKTANAVILRPDVKLTDADRAILDKLEAER